MTAFLQTVAAGRKRTWNTVLRLFIAAFLFVSMIGANAARANNCAGITISINAELYAAATNMFERDVRQAVSDVCRWWGETFTGEFEVNVENSRGPSMALVPAWKGQRGTMLFRTKTVEEGRALLHHEVVHVFAPNANRFLAEGLAVYAHELLNGVAGYPVNGQDLHAAAKPIAANVNLTALERIATPQRLQHRETDQEEAYTVAGSFVRFLIEEYGIEKFQRLYAMTPLVEYGRNPGDVRRWAKIYGHGLEFLSQRWLAKLLGF